VQHTLDYDDDPLNTDVLEAVAEDWYLNFKGYFDSYAYTDISSMYADAYTFYGPEYMTGSFVATIDS